MVPWEYTKEAWDALSWDEKGKAAEASEIEGPPYIHHSNYWATQVVNAARMGGAVPREVLACLGESNKHSLALQLLMEYSPTDDLRAWAIDILPETSIVEFVGREQAQILGGKVWAKFLAGIKELGWSCRGENRT